VATVVPLGMVKVKRVPVLASRHLYMIIYNARSPDLSICDFFLWGYLKEKVFKHRPHTLEELKDRIREEIGAIPVEMCQNAAEISEIAFISVSLLAAIIFLMSFLKLDYKTA